MSIVPFDGYQASRDELIANNWHMEETGNMGGSSRFLVGTLGKLGWFSYGYILLG